MLAAFGDLRADKATEAQADDIEGHTHPELGDMEHELRGDHGNYDAHYRSDIAETLRFWFIAPSQCIAPQMR